MERHGLKWGKKQYNIVKGYKNIIMTLANNHQESRGEWFSWVNKGNSGMKGTPSAGPYSSKAGVK